MLRVSSKKRDIADAEAIRLSAIDPVSAWLVVDTGTDNKPVYRVWSERTVKEQEHTCPDCLPPYELLSRAEKGQLTIIA